VYNDIEGPSKSTKPHPGHCIMAVNQTWHLPKRNTWSQHLRYNLNLNTFYNNEQHPARCYTPAYLFSPLQLHCELIHFDEI